MPLHPHRILKFFVFLVLGFSQLTTNLLPPYLVSPYEIPPADAYSVFLPLVINSLAPQIPDTTQVLPEDTLNALESIQEDGDFRFSRLTPNLSQVSVGDVIVGRTCSAAPSGFLRKVTGISQTGSQVILETEAATLEDAIQEGEIVVSQRLTPADLDGLRVTPGVRLIDQPSSQTDTAFVFDLNDVVIYDADGNPGTTGDQVKASGSIEFSPDYTFKLQVKNSKLQNLSFITHLDQTSTLEFSMETEVINQKVSYEIAHLYMGVITVMVGPVPVVMDLEMPLSVNLEGKVSVGVSTSVSQTNSLTAGLKYQNQEWTPVAVYQKEFRFEPPHLTAGVEIRGYIDVPLEINLYHVAGPYVSVQPYLSLKAAAGEDPWWSLKGGLDARAGFSMEILGHSLANHSQNVIQSSTTLAQAPYNPSPAMAASGIDLDTTLSWAMDGLNKDQFTYNVFLEAGETAPDVQVATRQTGTSFTPATLEEDKTYYWQVVPVNSLGQELPPGPVWSFTTTHPAEPGDMGFIPAGTFRMGCNGCEYDQDPVHTVYLDAYWIDVFEVTNSQYSGCVSSGNCEPPLSYDSSSHSSYYDNATYANYPVIRVSWYDAVDYCGWLGKRLPTEAEWEKAARGPNDLRQYPWGTGLPNCSLANMYCIHDTREVGATPNGASPYGIQDMLGNVQEWTNDWYLKDYYETSPAENPQGPAGGTLKVMRGGSWGSAFDKTYITLRFSLYGEPVSHGYGMGFRCAASAGE